MLQTLACQRETLRLARFVALVLVLIAATAPSRAATLDLMFVMDEAGGLSSADFFLQKSFVRSVADGVAVDVPFGADGLRSGAVAYGSSARRPVSLTGDASIFDNGVASILQAGGARCVSCALDEARSHLAGAGRSSAPDVIVLLLSGLSNVGTDRFAGAVASAKAAGIGLIAVGVGNADPVQVNAVASSPNDALFVSSWSAASGIQDDVVERILVRVPEPIPEPATLGLLAGGLLLLTGIAAHRRRSNRRDLTAASP